MHTQGHHFNQQLQIPATNYFGSLGIPSGYSQVQAPDISLGMLRPQAIQDNSSAISSNQRSPKPRYQSFNLLNRTAYNPEPFNPINDATQNGFQAQALSLKHGRVSDVGSCKVIKLEKREIGQKIRNQKLSSLDRLTSDTSALQSDVSLPNRHHFFNNFQSNSESLLQFEIDLPLPRDSTGLVSNPNLFSYEQLSRLNERSANEFRSMHMNSKPSPHN